MLVGYARTSTADQEAGLAAQERDLKAAGVKRLFSEQVSSTGKRPKLEEALAYCREDDTFIVTKPDRLARSTANLLEIVERLKERGVGLRILSMGGTTLDTTSPTGKMMLTMLAAVAEFELGLMRERQREGIKKAKDAGKFIGRQPTALRQTAELKRMIAEGVAAKEICNRLNISIRSFYRIKAGDAAPRPTPTSQRKRLIANTS